MTRRGFLQSTLGAWACGMLAAQAGQPPSTTGRGGLRTPTFYRHDLSFSSGRLHEPSADEEGNLWFSPCDGRLMRYHVPTGELQILDLQEITGRDWNGLHLWPVAKGRQVFLCCPTLPRLIVYRRDTGEFSEHDLPPDNPQVFGGFAPPEWDDIYFYPAPLVGEKSVPAVFSWDPRTHDCDYFGCPYELSGELYMTFADVARREIWGSTYTGNDLVRFDTVSNQWTGHWRCPLEGATPTPAGHVFGDMLYLSDHLKGRLIPFNARTQEWGEPVAIPGYREWFGYVGGGVEFRGLLYLCHSTWTGGNDSLDGKPHRFIGAWSVFDPETRAFSRLEIPAREGEAFVSAYGLVVGDVLCITAVNDNEPRNAVILRSVE